MEDKQLDAIALGGMMRGTRAYDLFKRGFDVMAAAGGLVATAPVMGVVALMVRKKLGSPVIFKQARPGKGEKIFVLYKFRTMKDVDQAAGLVSNEERMTPFGQKLRSTSLDELPSLLNVLKGDMSLIGPRPLLVEYLEKYSEEQNRRHEVRPGITGLAQVSGRNEVDWESRFALDVHYVDNRSLALDLKIIAKTIATVLAKQGISSAGHVVGAPFMGNRRDEGDDA